MEKNRIVHKSPNIVGEKYEEFFSLREEKNSAVIIENFNRSFFADKMFGFFVWWWLTD